MNEIEMLRKQRDELNERIRRIRQEKYYAEIHKQTENVKKIFAERLMMLCKNKRKLAAYLSVNPSVITRYGSGNHLPRLAHLIGIAEYFGVSIDYLFGRTDKKAVNVADDNQLRVIFDDDDESDGLLCDDYAEGQGGRP